MSKAEMAAVGIPHPPCTAPHTGGAAPLCRTRGWRGEVVTHAIGGLSGHSGRSRGPARILGSGCGSTSKSTSLGEEAAGSNPATPTIQIDRVRGHPCRIIA